MADVEADPLGCVLLLIVIDIWFSNHLRVPYRSLLTFFTSMEVLLLLKDCLQLALLVLQVNVSDLCSKCMDIFEALLLLIHNLLDIRFKMQSLFLMILIISIIFWTSDVYLSCFSAHKQADNTRS